MATGEMMAIKDHEAAENLRRHMQTEIGDSIDADERAMEKLARSMERIATVMENRYAQEYPEKRDVRDATITRIPNEEDRIRENHGASSQPLEEWINELGPREREVLGKETRKKKK